MLGSAFGPVSGAPFANAVVVPVVCVLLVVRTDSFLAKPLPVLPELALIPDIYIP